MLHKPAACSEWSANGCDFLRILVLCNVQMVTACAADDSTVAELGRLVERAAGEKSPLEGAVAKFAKWCAFELL